STTLRNRAQNALQAARWASRVLDSSFSIRSVLINQSAPSKAAKAASPSGFRGSRAALQPLRRGEWRSAGHRQDRFGEQAVANRA
ncbi:hypothetical protein BZL55_08140, partial [Helicobacter pylori]